MLRGIVAFILGDLLVGIVFALTFWFSGGTVAPAFDYAAANADERAAWLTAQADAITATVRNSLPPATDDTPAMQVHDTLVDPRKRSIEVIVRVAGGARLGNDAAAFKKKLAAKRCPQYAASALGRNGIYVLETYRKDGEHPMLTVGVTPIVCRAYL